MTEPDLGAEWRRIRGRLSGVAQPDSRFDLDLDRFIPAFDGVEAATARAIAQPEYAAAKVIFVTPDNAIQPFRHAALRDGKALIVPSYGLHRGFVEVDPSTVGAGHALFASWGDSLQHFGRPVPFEDLPSRPTIDLVVAGAAAVSRNGVRFGMGSIYLDVEWNALRGAGLVSDATSVWTVVHDCQILHRDVPGCAEAVVVDGIFTQTAALGHPGAAKPSLVCEATLVALFGGAPEPAGLRRVLRLAETYHLESKE